MNKKYRKGSMEYFGEYYIDVNSIWYGIRKNNSQNSTNVLIDTWKNDKQHGVVINLYK